jgi:hypothetical protein
MRSFYRIIVTVSSVYSYNWLLIPTGYFRGNKKGGAGPKRALRPMNGPVQIDNDRRRLVARKTFRKSIGAMRR